MSAFDMEKERTCYYLYAIFSINGRKSEVALWLFQFFKVALGLKKRLEKPVLQPGIVFHIFTVIDNAPWEVLGQSCIITVIGVLQECYSPTPTNYNN